MVAIMTGEVVGIESELYRLVCRGSNRCIKPTHLPADVPTRYRTLLAIDIAIAVALAVGASTVAVVVWMFARLRA